MNGGDTFNIIFNIIFYRSGSLYTCMNNNNNNNNNNKNKNK